MANIIVLAPKGATVSVSGENIFIEDTRDEHLWYESDQPTEASMATYLRNVAAIRSALTVLSTTPEVPPDMEGLTYTEANNIEKILENVDLLLTRAAQAWFYAGDVFSGEV